MTDPILAISTTDEIGRLYQTPSGGFAATLSEEEALAGLASNKLFPSITNVVDVINPKMEGYIRHMTKRSYQETGSIEDAIMAAEVYLYATADRGTRVHKFIEDFIEAGYTTEQQATLLESYGVCEENDEEWGDLGYVKSFFKFLAWHKPDFLHQEATVYGYSLSGIPYAGTTDFVAKIRGKVIIGDWKTTSKLRETVALQLAAVQNASKMTTDFSTLEPMVQASECWGVQLKKFGFFQTGRVENIDRAFQLFSSALELWRLKAGVEKTLQSKKKN